MNSAKLNAPILSSRPLKILISACLLGEKVRYDGRACQVHSELLEKWKRQGRLVSFCPEVASGLPVPRPPAEIIARHGTDVLHGDVRVLTAEKEDVTKFYLFGAIQALEIANIKGIQIAILKSRSPSCGSGEIYDGTFSGKTVSGNGVTAALLKKNEIAVFKEKQIKSAWNLLKGGKQFW